MDLDRKSPFLDLKNPSPRERNPLGIKWIYAALFLLISFLGIHNHLWLRAHWPFPTFSWYAGYFDPVPHFRALFKSGKFLSVIEILFKLENTDVYALTAGLLSLVDKSQLWIGLANNMPYLALAVVSVYKLGEWVSDRRTGLLAATLFSLYPSVYGISRHHCEEFAVMCVSVFAVWSLLKADEFRNRRYSIWFGVAFGWGMLIKYVMFVYLFGPMSVVFASMWLGRKSLRSERLLNLGLSMGTALAMIGPKYFNPTILKAYLVRPVMNPITEPWNSAFNLEMTVFAGIVYHLALPFFALWMACCIPLWKHTRSKVKWSLLLWIFVPWIAVTGMRHIRNAFYLIHFTAPMAVISAYGVMRTMGKNRKAFVAAVIGIIVIGMAQFYDFSFGTRLRLHEIVWAHLEGRDLLYYRPEDGICRPPDKNAEILMRLEKLKTLCTGRRGILLVGEDNAWQNAVWAAILWYYDIPFTTQPSYSNISDVDLEQFRQADMLLLVSTPLVKDLKSWLQGTIELAGQNIRHHSAHPLTIPVENYYNFISQHYKDIENEFMESTSLFHLSDTIPLWPNTAVQIYKRSPL